MSLDSHATITYTLMSSYEVIVNGYFRMPMDPLDPYVQLVMEAPPSPDYIPGPEAPPSPDYIPGPQAPPSPDYIPGPEYPEYLPPADDVLPAEEQPLPAAVSPTAESPGYTTEGDDDADDDGDDLSEDDADDEDEEESSDKVERLLAIPTPPLSPVSLTSYPLPPFLMPLPIFTPLPTSSFPLPLSLPSTSGSKSIPEADIPLRKRARFTTPTSRYEIMDYCQSREVHTSTLVSQIEALQRDVSTLQRQHIDDEDRLTRHIQHEHAQRDVSPEDGHSCS
nr:hypothetical protein [Tanacetum cinerariifolium]